MIKILITSNLNTLNPYIDELYKGVLQSDINIELFVDVKLFWSKEKFDIIHIQWPEYLKKIISDNDIKEIEERLTFYKSQKTKIIVTRHNFWPHNLPSNLSHKLYNLIYEYSDAVIHLGEFSLTNYFDIYKDHSFVKYQQQIVIPHHIYNSIPNSMSKEECRKILGIQNHKFVVLIFGAIRNRKEILKTFDFFSKLKNNNKLLLVHKWNFNPMFTSENKFLRKIINKTLNKLGANFNKFYFKLIYKKYFYFNKNEVGFSDSQLYLNACDILLIPRDNVLNSGNVFLGLAFDKTIIGPSCGNIKEHLLNTGNILLDDLCDKKCIFEGNRKINVQKSYPEEYTLNYSIKKHIEIYYKILK